MTLKQARQTLQLSLRVVLTLVLTRPSLWASFKKVQIVSPSGVYADQPISGRNGGPPYVTGNLPEGYPPIQPLSPADMAWIKRMEKLSAALEAQRQKLELMRQRYTPVLEHKRQFYDHLRMNAEVHGGKVHWDEDLIDMAKDLGEDPKKIKIKSGQPEKEAPTNPGGGGGGGQGGGSSPIAGTEGEIWESILDGQYWVAQHSGHIDIRTNYHNSPGDWLISGLTRNEYKAVKKDLALGRVNNPGHKTWKADVFGEAPLRRNTHARHSNPGSQPAHVVDVLNVYQY